MSDLHPDFLAVDAAHQWTGPLNELYPVLRKEAWRAEGSWRYRVLPHGALVSVRIVPPGDKASLAFATELRIARRTAPADAEAWKKWAQELAVFLRHLTGEDDVWEALPIEPGKADARFRFLMKGERAKPVCTHCGATPVIQPGLFKEDVCAGCATELANQEIAANNAQREASHGPAG